MNEKRSVLIFNIVFLLLLIAVTHFYTKSPGFSGPDTRPVNILSDIIKDTANVDNPDAAPGTNRRIKTIDNKGNKINDYTVSSDLINSSGQQFALGDFFQKLSELKRKKRKKIRIAYFGDSMIEGDLIT